MGYRERRGYAFVKYANNRLREFIRNNPLVLTTTDNTREVFELFLEYEAERRKENAPS